MGRNGYNDERIMKAAKKGKSPRENGLTFTGDLVRKVASLAKIPVTPVEEASLSQGFTATMKVVDGLFAVETGNLEPTHQVTGLVNILREDVVDEKRMFSQDSALKNARSTHNGYFVVDRLIGEDL